jgi:glutathione S-transferase
MGPQPSKRARLRYFDCRSRGQALRFALAGLGIEFEDERVAVEDLQTFRERAADVDFGGPFASLPLLDWNCDRIAQTLAIAGYLEDRIGAGSRPGADTIRERAFLAMVTSAAHLDTQLPYSQLLWQSADLGEDALRDSAARLLAHLDRKLAQLESLLVQRDIPLFGGSAPGLADYFVYESLSRGRAVFGAAFTRTLTSRPRLRALEAAIEGQPGIADLLVRRDVPCAITASPSERALRARIAALGFD